MYLINASIDIINIKMIEVRTEQELSGHSFYFFVNTKSGNQQGQRMMDVKHHLTFRQTIHFTFVDLFDQPLKARHMQHLKTEIEESKTNIKTIVCGGDGTVNWVINDFAAYGIDMTKMVFGLLPIGTGNDLCRSLGWNVDEVDYTAEIVNQRIAQWLQASQSKYDVWDVTIQAYPNGDIHDIRNKIEYVETQRKMKKMFVNYVGLGLDGRIVYTMQKCRTSSAAFNKILYGLVGCFNNFFRPMKELKRKIQQFTEHLDGFGSQSNTLLMKKSRGTASTNENILVEEQLRSVNPLASQFLSTISHTFKKGFKGMVFLNCTSYMCGLRQMWQTSSFAVKEGQLKPDFCGQNYSDGKIQVLAYKSEFRLALERIMRGGAYVTQGNGPFQISFNQMQEQTTYMQIDGESLIVNNLKSLRINKTSNINNHQINILVKPPT